MSVIECRQCTEPRCDGCNLFILSEMLRDRKLDNLMDGQRSINPAADVRPVVRGKWAIVFGIGTVCNQCGYDIEEHGYDVRTDGEPNFCPNCGADMRGEQDV